ncbi:MAG: hypothetical protein WC477_01530 [Patescibacteria group bacterium]
MTQLAIVENPSQQSLAFANDFPPIVRSYFEWNLLQSEGYVDQRAQRQTWRENHTCTYSFELCVDERLSDFLRAVGLMAGIPNVSRSPGGFESNLGYPLTQKRLFAFHEEYCLNGHMEVHLVTYHYSGSQTNHGCAARKNNTEQYRSDAIEHAKRLNRALNRSIIAFSVGVDTDDDSLVVHGTNGDVCLREYALDVHDPFNKTLRSRLSEHLAMVFPSQRGLFRDKSSRTAEAFYQEFAELLASNVHYVRQRRAELARSGPEKESHTALRTFIGRPLDMEPPKGTTFLLEDGDPRLMGKYVAIPLKIVCKNALQHVMITGNTDNFVIPYIISIPYRNGNRGLKQESALDIAEMVKRTAHTWLPGILSQFERTNWWGELTEQLRVLACREAVDRVLTFPCVHDERTRLFVPVS